MITSPASERTPTGERRPESVLVVVYTHAGEALLLRRVSPAGFWQSVTGALRAGETPEQAARRELEEELGVDAADALVDTGVSVEYRIAPAWRHRYAPGVNHNCEHQFTLALDGRIEPVLDRSEHVDYAWHSLPEAARRASSASDRAAILRVLQSVPCP